MSNSLKDNKKDLRTGGSSFEFLQCYTISVLEQGFDTLYQFPMLLVAYTQVTFISKVVNSSSIQYVRTFT